MKKATNLLTPRLLEKLGVKGKGGGRPCATKALNWIKRNLRCVAYKEGEKKEKYKKGGAVSAKIVHLRGEVRRSGR